MRAVFYAKDGTEFEDRWDCEAYEEFLDHSALKGIIFSELGWGEESSNCKQMKIEDYSGILEDSIYQKTNSMYVHNEEEVSDLQWLASWGGWCEWEQITSPGLWFRRCNKDTQEGKWINVSPTQQEKEMRSKIMNFIAQPPVHDYFAAYLKREEDQND